MKTLSTALLLTLIALTSVACGDTDPVSRYEGVYSGSATLNSRSEYWDGTHDEDTTVAEGFVVVTKSESGDLLVTELIPGCPLVAESEGEYFTVSGVCIVTNAANDVRVSYQISGEGELTNSGRMSLDAEFDSTVEGKFQYEHGFEWEVVETTKSLMMFTGKPM